MACRIKDTYSHLLLRRGPYGLFPLSIVTRPAGTRAGGSGMAYPRGHPSGEYSMLRSGAAYSSG